MNSGVGARYGLPGAGRVVVLACVLAATLGLQTCSFRAQPAQIVLSVGIRTACAVLADGTAACWGANDQGQLGNGTTDSLVHTPTLVSGLTDAVAIGTSTNHACALTASGHVECWGSNVRGTLGDETQDPHSTPALVHGPLPGQILGSVTALGVGAGHSCAVDAAGAVYCWGMNEFGQLGNGDGTDRLIATPVSTPTGFRFVDVAVGRYHVCALTRNGMVYCWGANDHDQLGNGTGLPSAVPVLVADIWHARTIGAGANHTCVVLSILSRRTSHCWGASDGSYGESLPQPDLTSLERASGGAHHTCALDQSGRVYCWGSNINHQLGTPDAVGSTTTSCPVRDPDPSHCISPPRLMASGVAVLATGDTTTCVTTSHGQIRCWGDNLSGLAGSGAPQDSSSFFVDSATPRLADLPGVGTARVP